MAPTFLKARWFHVAIGFGVSIVLLTWMAFSLDWEEIGEVLLSARWWMLLPVTIILLIHFVLRSLRWRVLLAGGSAVRLPILWDAIIVGNFATYVLPLRAGEFIRPLYLSRLSPISFTAGFLSVVIERFLDLSMVLIAFGFVVTQVPGLPSWARDGALSLGVLAAILLATLLSAAVAPQLLERCAAPVLKRLPIKIAALGEHIMREVIVGAAVLRSPTRFIAALFITLMIWLSTFLQFYCYLLFFPGAASPLLAVTIAVVVALAVAAPSAPGFIGVFQVACIAAFSLFAVGREIGAAYSILAHLHHYVFFVLYGPWILSQSKLNLSNLRENPAGAGVR